MGLKGRASLGEGAHTKGEVQQHTIWRLMKEGQVGSGFGDVMTLLRASGARTKRSGNTPLGLHEDVRILDGRQGSILESDRPEIHQRLASTRSENL